MSCLAVSATTGCAGAGLAAELEPSPRRARVGRARTGARTTATCTIPAAAAVLLAAACASPPPPATRIVGALLVDGTGAAARAAEVRIRGERVVAVAPLLEPLPDEEVIDAAGLVLAPGFIDTHSHHDSGLLAAPAARGAVCQGITTIVVGQDGDSHWQLRDWFERLEREPPSVNVASYTGHGTLRELAMGDDFRRPATPAEIADMRALLAADMTAGSLGLSSGLEYDPGAYATTAELIELARVAAWYGGSYVSHLRSEDRALFAAIEELVGVGREAGLPVHVSHVKLAMKSLWGRAGDLIARLEDARAEGIEVTADVYPYTYWQSTMTVLLPERDFEDRAAAEFALTELAPPEGIVLARFDAQPEYAGRTLAEVAALRGTDAVTAYLDLIRAARAAGAGESIIATSMDPADVRALAAWPGSSFCSDGSSDGGHPRGHGAFARVLGRFVRAEGVLSLEQAVHKMTGLPARQLGLSERGCVRPGGQADLVLFDPARVIDRATVAHPHAAPAGIERVWVNGCVVWDGERATGARCGAVLRRSVAP